MVLMNAAILAVPLLAGIAAWLFVLYMKLRRAEAGRRETVEKYGVLVEVAPGNRAAVKESVLQCAEAKKGIMDLTYYSCDNFKKYQSKVSEKMEELYSSGALQNLCSDVVYLANLAENGVFYKLAKEYRLTELELRTCCFIYLGFKWQHTCTADSLTENAYNVRCSRIRKKFSLTKEERIPDFLEKWCKKYNPNSSVQ